MSKPTFPERVDRRQCIIAAARSAFLDRGYAGTSMSAIAAQVGGSKSTFWTAFPSKEALFTAVLDSLILEFRSQLAGLLDPDEDMAATLERFARAFLGKLLADTSLRLRRLVNGEVERFPEIGRLFYERGPEPSQRVVATYLARQMATGHLKAADPLVAAAQFLALVQAGSYQRALLKIGPAPLDDELNSDVETAVTSFLSCYRGTTGAAPPLERPVK